MSFFSLHDLQFLKMDWVKTVWLILFIFDLVIHYSDVQNVTFSFFWFFSLITRYRAIYSIFTAIWLICPIKIIPFLRPYIFFFSPNIKKNESSRPEATIIEWIYMNSRPTGQMVFSENGNENGLKNSWIKGFGLLGDMGGR